MARKQREKKPFFTQMQFDNVQYAMDVKAKSEKKLKRAKIGLILAAVAEVMMVCIGFFCGDMDVKYAMPIIYVWWAVIAASYIVGGGLGMALKATWKIAKEVGFIGWFCVPFPADIFTGLFLTGAALCMIPVLFVIFPIVLVFCAYWQVRKDYKAAEEYLSYCH